MYLNQALIVGIDEELQPADLDLVTARSEAHGVAPAIEVTPTTRPGSLQRIHERGYVHQPDADISCLTRSVTGPAVDGPDDVEVRPVETAADLALWQETSAHGWGHETAAARRTSDAFAAAANALDREHMVIAVDRSDGRPIGCASMTVREEVAMLGGMSTLPADRRRGVQAALLRHRLAEAARLGCELAVTTAARGGPSARNLERHGFVPTVIIERFARPLTG